MKNMPFRYVQQHMVGTRFSLGSRPLTLTFDSTLAKADGSVSQSSMVAENLRRMEMQEEEAKPAFENALKKAATTAIVGK